MFILLVPNIYLPLQLYSKQIEGHQLVKTNRFTNFRIISYVPMIEDKDLNNI